MKQLDTPGRGREAAQLDCGGVELGVAAEHTDPLPFTCLEGPAERCQPHSLVSAPPEVLSPVGAAAGMYVASEHRRGLSTITD